MILLAGPPGAGKSVQARLLEKVGNVQGISIGKILRENLKEEHKALMERGELLPDEVVHGALVAAVEKIPLETRIILDGFPRSQSQIDWFLSYIDASDRKVQGVIHIMVTEEAALSRLSKRGRMDDVEETIRRRYAQYTNEIKPLLESLRALDMTVHDIDGMGSIEETHQTVVEEVNHLI